MTCKHNWIPSLFGFKHIPPNYYLYECARCGGITFAQLKEKS